MAAIDLCTLAQVREYLQKKVADTAQDAVLSAMITRASALIMRVTEHDFLPAATETRTFNYGSSGLVWLAPAVLRSVSAVVLDPNGSSPQTLTAADYRLRTSGPSGYYRRLAVIGRYDGRFGFGEVRVTGAWGYAALADVPPEIQHAAVVTVSIWARREVQAFSTTFSIDEGRLERPEPLPSAVMGILESWMPAPTV